MKLVLFSCLLAFAAAAPHPESSAETLVDERSDDGDGNFNYRFETSNGISERRSGAPGSEGQSNMEGAYSFTLPDGSRLELVFVADELGYRPESAALPVGPPTPEHVLETLALVEELKRQGAKWDDQGTRIARRK